MKRSVIWAGLALVVVCGIGGLATSQFAGARQAAKPKEVPHVIATGDLLVSVVENGTIDAVKSVEVKSRVTGRVAQLLVDEGDIVQAGQLIAVIDPQETELRVQQDRAQLDGAQSAVNRANLEIDQRRVTAEASVRQAEARIRQLELEVKTQPTISQAAVREAETALETARQERRRLVETAHPNEIVSADAAVREAEINLETARRETERQKNLLENGWASAKAVEQASQQEGLARVRLDTARDGRSRLTQSHAVALRKADEAILQAQASLSRARANQLQDPLKQRELDSARAELAKARAALKDPAILAAGRAQSAATVRQLSSVLNDSERQLRETEIRAPIAGVVTKRGIQVGELATGLSTFGAGTTIVKIEDRAKMRVKLNMNEIDTARIRVGMPASIAVDALPRTRLTGTVTRIAPASVEATAGQASSADAVVRYQVEINLNTVPPDLRSGMSAKCTMNVVDLKGVTLVPIEYIRKAGDQAFVVTTTGQLDSQGKLVTEEREVKLGSESGSAAEIKSGVKVGDKLLRPEFTGPARKSMIEIGAGD